MWIWGLLKKRRMEPIQRKREFMAIAEPSEVVPSDDIPAQETVQSQYEAQLALLNQQQTEYLNALKESSEAAQATSQAQLDLAEEQMQMSRDERDYYEENFLPLEEDLIARAKEGISGTEAASTAEKYVRGSYDATQGALDRNYQRLGIDITDPMYAKTNQSLEAFREAAVAGAKNDARYAANEATKNLQLSVAGMGRGIPASSLQAFNTSAQAIGESASSAQTGTNGVAAASSNINNVNANNIMTNAAGISQSNQLRVQTEYQRDINDAQTTANIAGMVGSGVGIAAGSYGGSKQPSTGSSGISSGSNIGNTGWSRSSNLVN